jgi:sugar phosphate isomerase/epimerase
VIDVLTVLHGYSFRDYPVEHVLRVARAGHWPAIEFASWHFDRDDPIGHIGATVREARAMGVAVHCVGYWGLFADADEAARRQSVDRVCEIVRAAAVAGVTLVNGSAGWLVADPVKWDLDWTRNGSAMATDADVERVADGYRRVAECGAAHGVRVAVEVHPNTVHDTVRATARLLALVDHDNLFVTLDPSNAAVLSPDERDVSIVDLVAGRVEYFHLKNCLLKEQTADFTVDAAAGVIDNYRWLERLSRLGVGAVAIEYCGDGDPHPRVAAARRYLDETLSFIPRMA